MPSHLMEAGNPNIHNFFLVAIISYDTVIDKPSICLQTGKRQQTLAAEVCLSGIGLHSGAATTARLFPAMAGEGRYFVAFGLLRIPATIEYAVNSSLCTTLCRGGVRVRTVEHLLSALEACGVDNCRIEIEGGEEVTHG
ncbi:putative UDP-3-O-[3-hydroxymyristoyl] N-acetylglucosamine deacetylase 5 [Dendrobium catenatum]|uniref:Putative UDP-3-O-[3-hydroxymyristoyl] N-acetylglucosamine deacetylase 5 n=1 Tax=Dendrobium catenatum TaxID=906689 RepID=A0A2I0XB97_9ASPA|nr:putative UDP-3-O-[3-hydroxymyristoyl] N-acetylglucosamine deacetylase 5 [Dendrobium catenatum]